MKEARVQKNNRKKERMKTGNERTEGKVEREEEQEDEREGRFRMERSRKQKKNKIKWQLMASFAISSLWF